MSSDLAHHHMKKVLPCTYLGAPDNLMTPVVNLRIDGCMPGTLRSILQHVSAHTPEVQDIVLEGVGCKELLDVSVFCLELDAAHAVL